MPTVEAPTLNNWFQSIEKSSSGRQKQIDFSRLGEILQNLGDNAWAHDFATGNTWYSADYNIFIGYSNRDITSRKADLLWWQSIHPDDLYLIKESDAKYKNAEQDKHSLEYRIIDCKGKQRWVLDRGVVVERDDAGKPLVIVGTHIDMTPLRDLQHELDEVEHKRKREVVDVVIRNLEADRKMIAEELHGNVNQILTAARMMLEFIPVMSEEMGRYTEKVKQIIYTAVDEVNKIFNDINPDALQHVAMGDLIRDMIQRMNKDRHIKVELDMQGYETGAKKNHDRELTLLRVVQEALHRVFSQSKGERLVIRLHCHQEYMLFELFANDPDFDLDSVSGDLRMVNLTNRCEHFGGTFHLEKARGEGVYFKASVPLG
jgi:signal transduction histidine kinase